MIPITIKRYIDYQINRVKALIGGNSNPIIIKKLVGSLESSNTTNPILLSFVVNDFNLPTTLTKVGTGHYQGTSTIDFTFPYSDYVVFEIKDYSYNIYTFEIYNVGDGRLVNLIIKNNSGTLINIVPDVSFDLRYIY